MRLIIFILIIVFWKYILLLFMILLAAFQKTINAVISFFVNNNWIFVVFEVIFSLVALYVLFIIVTQFFENIKNSFSNSYKEWEPYEPDESYYSDSLL